MSSTLVAAGWGGLLVACCWAAREIVLHRRLGTFRTDPVTGLPVRNAFYRRAHRALRRPGTVVLVIDLDRFKPINDQLGHAAGDQVLATIGARLRATLGRGAVLGRLGGDEFAAVVAMGPVDTPWLDAIRDLEQAIRAPIPVPGVRRPVTVGVSIGAIHLAGLDRPALSAVLHVADRVMFQAKHRGGGVLATTADVSDPYWSRPLPRRPDQRGRHDVAAPVRSPRSGQARTCHTA
jgi:diguanylate cyclase (GGDEF)-like protein